MNVNVAKRGQKLTNTLHSFTRCTAGKSDYGSVVSWSLGGSVPGWTSNSWWRGVSFMEGGMLVGIPRAEEVQWVEEP